MKKGMFKTESERRAYAMGRRHQYNKEHPKYKWKVQADGIYMKNGGKVDYKFTDVAIGSSKHTSKKSALEALRAAIKREKNNKEYVLSRSKAGKLDEYDSQDCSYYDFKLVRIDERKK